MSKSKEKNTVKKLKFKLWKDMTKEERGKILKARAMVNWMLLLRNPERETDS